MRNERLHEGNRVSAAVPDGTKSGDPVIVLGDVPGVAATDRGKGGNIAGRATVWTEGVYTLATTDAVSAEGTKVYLTSAGGLTTTSTSNTLFGRTVHSAEGIGGTKSSGAGRVNVRLGKV